MRPEQFRLVAGKSPGRFGAESMKGLQASSLFITVRRLRGREESQRTESKRRPLGDMLQGIVVVPPSKFSSTEVGPSPQHGSVYPLKGRPDHCELTESHRLESQPPLGRPRTLTPGPMILPDATARRECRLLRATMASSNVQADAKT